MWLEPTNIIEGIFEYDSHTDTCILGKVWRIMIIYEYSAKFYRLSEKIVQLEPPIVDTTTIVRTENDDGVIINVNQALFKPD